MFLLLFTLLYCFLTQIVGIGYLPALGIYLIGLTFIKGMLSDDLKGDLLNIRETKYLYDKNGHSDSIIELLSLLLVSTHI